MPSTGIISDAILFMAVMPCTQRMNTADITITSFLITSKLTLWEDYTDSLVEGSSYSLKNFVVREYASMKYLSMPREGYQIKEIDNIGDVEQQ